MFGGHLLTKTNVNASGQGLYCLLIGVLFYFNRIGIKLIGDLIPGLVNEHGFDKIKIVKCPFINNYTS